MEWQCHGELLQVETHANTSSGALGLQLSLWLSGSGLQVHEAVFKYFIHVWGEFRDWLKPGDQPYAENNQ